MIALVTASETASATLSAVAGLQPLRRARMRAAPRARRTLEGPLGSSSSPQIAEGGSLAIGSAFVRSTDSAMSSVFPERARIAPHFSVRRAALHLGERRPRVLARGGDRHHV